MKILPEPLGKVETTARGFEIIHFADRYDNAGSLQASSLADNEKPGTSAVWLGIDNADPKIMAIDASKFGIETKETTGWVPFPIPEEVLLNTRLHLDRKQAASLILHLQSWLDNDTFVL